MGANFFGKSVNTIGGRAIMARTIRLTALASFAALVLLGCMNAPRWRYDQTGAAREYKRYARNIAVDYFTRFSRKAYDPVTRPIADFLTDEQRDYVEKQGQPDYRRRPFQSRLDEEVDEWIYLEQNRMVQFVRGYRVYEGEVTDLERIMIRYGYPRGVIMGQVEPGIERFTLVYGRPWDLEREVFSFADGKLVFSQTLR